MRRLFGPRQVTFTGTITARKLTAEERERRDRGEYPIAEPPPRPYRLGRRLAFGIAILGLWIAYAAMLQR